MLFTIALNFIEKYKLRNLQIKATKINYLLVAQDIFLNIVILRTIYNFKHLFSYLYHFFLSKVSKIKFKSSITKNLFFLMPII